MNLSTAELDELYARYSPVVYRRCLALLGNEEDARDALQETFAKVLRHGDRFRQEASPMTWMYRIATNHCLNVLRNRTGRRRKLEEHRRELTEVVPSWAPDRHALDRPKLLSLLEDADEQTRRCVIYTFFDDCTRQEVAELVGLSVPTVRKRIQSFLSHARRTLDVTSVAAFLWFVRSLP